MWFLQLQHDDGNNDDDAENIKKEHSKENIWDCELYIHAFDSSTPSPG